MHLQSFAQAFSTSHHLHQMDHSKVNSKKKKLSSQSISFLLVVVVLVLLGTFGLYYYTWKEKSPGDAIHIKEYEALLIRAKELTDKYKDLASGAILPSAVSPTASGGGGVGNLRSPNVHSGSVIEKADLVLGMAQDTDPKNLVMLNATYMYGNHVRVIDYMYDFFSLHE